MTKKLNLYSAIVALLTLSQGIAAEENASELLTEREEAVASFEKEQTAMEESIAAEEKASEFLTEREEAVASIEQGQTTMGETFDWSSRRLKNREQRRAALSNIVYNVEFRSMYFDRSRFNGSDSKAWAIGGSAGFKTGYFLDHIQLAMTGYTSQPLYNPEDKDGTNLLKPGQNGYSVLGQLYSDVVITENLHLYAGRRVSDSPYINQNDGRMTPNTFEAITVLGYIGGSGESPNFTYGFGYFDKIKERNSDKFVSMSKDAGANVERGVYTIGGNFKVGDFSIGAMNYYCEDIINIAYAEARCAVPLPSGLKLNLAAQYSDQESTGANHLTGEHFSAHQLGLKADFPLGDAMITAAYTATGDGDRMRSPWSGYPGYSSAQIENFNRAGEDAFLLRAAYAFTSLEGFSVYAVWVNGANPDNPEQYAREEYDMNIQWRATSGLLKGMTLRARYALAGQDEGDVEDIEDIRLICYYSLFSWP